MDTVLGIIFMIYKDPENLQRKFSNFFQVTIKKMDLLTQSLKTLHIKDETYSGENLSNEIQFLEETKEKVEETFTSLNCIFYYGKRVMTCSVELTITLTAEIAHKILTNVDEILDVHFAKKEDTS